MLLGFHSLAILVSIASLYITQNKEKFASVLKTALVLNSVMAYMWAGFHKLNYDFFNSDVSCSYDILKNYNSIFGSYFLEPTYMYIVSIAIVVGELATLLILWGRFGNKIIGLLSFAHLLILFNLHDTALGAFYTIIMIGLHFILSKDVLKFFEFEKLGRLPSLLIGLAFILVSVLETQIKSDNYSPVAQLSYFILILVLLYKSMSKDDEKIRYDFKSWIMISLMAIHLFNGFSQYLGLKNEKTFSMYSNLSTEKNYFNHFFMPESFQVFDWQKTYINVTETNSRVLNHWMRRSPGGIPEIIIKEEFERYRYKDESLYVKYRDVDGSEKTIDFINSDWSSPVLWIFKPLLSFKWMPLQVSPRECTH
jgi:hypothetical protein